MISRENNFDLIRLFAASQVMAVHGIAHLKLDGLSNIYSFLHSFPGVLMFFTMSGFLIMSSFDRNQNLKKYTMNRVLRIFPALYLCFFITLILLIGFKIIDISDLFSSPILEWIFTQISFFQFWTPDILRSWGVGTPNGSLWTIVVELQFYILLPILILGFKKIQLIYKIGTLAIISILFNIYLSTKKIDFGENTIYKLSEVSILPYLYCFLIGVIIYMYWDKIKMFFEGKAIFWLILYFIFCSLTGIMPSYYPSNLQLIANILLSILTISCAFTFRKWGKILKSNDISYGMYIYHMLVINTLVHLGYIGKTKYLLVTVLLTAILSSFSWFFIERKAMLLKNKFK